MKKIIRNRSDHTETATINNHHNIVMEKTNLEIKEKKEIKPVVQPPLPPYPPPPDSPLNLNLTIKQEKTDDDEESSAQVDTELKAVNTETAVEELPAEQKQCPKKTICKEFIRGKCTRPVCKFAHEVDLSQLAGVFTFCWNYQNAVCTFPNCRFVHATVFEEAEFYRTGVLPPHARNHLNKALPPPPPPEESRQDNFNNASLRTEVEKQSSVINCVPVSNIQEGYRAPLSQNMSPQKREWADIDEFNSSPRDLETNLAKKCKKCELREFSFNYNKEMVQNMMQSSEELNKKINQLNKKSSKLFNVLLTFLKPGTMNKSPLNNFVTSSEKEKLLMDQLNNFVTTNNRLPSAINDENFKSALGHNTHVSNLMAKLFSMPTDRPKSTDNNLAKCS